MDLHGEELDMTQPDGKAVLAAVNYVRELYSNTSRLLLAADSPLAERGWAPHGSSWKPIPQSRGTLAKPDRWLPHYVIRQYYREDEPQTKEELLTIAVIPFDPVDNRIEEPLCLASRVRRMVDDDKVYWIPQVQLRCEAGIGPLGEVRRITRDMLAPKQARLNAFEALVKGDELLSIAVPLVSLVDDEILATRLLDPILGAAYSRV
jgi:hypothetical protein